MTDISELSNLGIEAPSDWPQMSADQQDAWAESAKASMPQTGFGPAVNDAQRDSAFQSNWNTSHGGETHWDSGQQSWATGAPAATSSPRAQASSSGGITSTPITPTTTQNGADPGASVDVDGGADAGLTHSFKRALAEQAPPPATAVSIDIVLELDGMGATIPNASYGWISRNKFPARIIDVTLQNVRAESGSITIDIQTCTPGAAPTWTSICAAAIPAISGSPYYYDAVLTGWTTVLQRGQGLRAVVSGVATFTQMSVCLGARRLDLTADT